MPAYIIATVTIHDAARFAAYGKAVARLSERDGGEYLVRGPVTELLKGDAPAGERVVVSRFPSADAARAHIRPNIGQPWPNALTRQALSCV